MAFVPGGGSADTVQYRTLGFPRGELLPRFLRRQDNVTFLLLRKAVT